jgi:hypothetical protein
MVEYGSDLERRINEVVAEDERTRDFEIDIIENNGIVEIRGKVPSEEDRRRIEQMIESQAGVVEVVNHLQLLEEDRPVAEDDDFPELDRGEEPPAYHNRSG